LARQGTERSQLSRSEVVAYLRSLPSLWADTTQEGRQTMASALFSTIDVLGFERMTCDLTTYAVELGLNAALPGVFELNCSIGELVGARGLGPTHRHVRC
jgi:hypothetical protein